MSGLFFRAVRSSPGRSLTLGHVRVRPGMNEVKHLHPTRLLEDEGKKETIALKEGSTKDFLYYNIQVNATCLIGRTEGYMGTPPIYVDPSPAAKTKRVPLCSIKVDSIPLDPDPAGGEVFFSEIGATDPTSSSMNSPSGILRP